MSSLEDLHWTKAETSVTAPFISIETILTGMATVRPVRMAVLIISVSCGKKEEQMFMTQQEVTIITGIYQLDVIDPHVTSSTRILA